MLIYRTKILILLGISFVFVLSSQFSLILSLLLSLLFTFLGSCCFLWFSKLLVSVSSTNECAIAWFILFFRFFYIRSVLLLLLLLLLLDSFRGSLILASSILAFVSISYCVHVYTWIENWEWAHRASAHVQEQLSHISKRQRTTGVHFQNQENRLK